MREKKLSLGARLLDNIFGLILIGLASTVFWLPQSYLTLMIVFLGIALFFLGISRIIYGYREKLLASWQRTLNMILGVTLMVISVPVMISNYLGGIIWILVLGIALVVFGLNILITGLFSPAQKTWFRILEIVGGATSVTLGVVAVFASQLGAIILLLFLALGIAFAGVYLIIIGILGHQFLIAD